MRLSALEITAAFLYALLLSACSSTPPQTMLRDMQAGIEVNVPAGWTATLGYGDVRWLLREPNSNSAVRASIMWDKPTAGGPANMDDYRRFRLPRLGYFGKQHQLLLERAADLNPQQTGAYEVEYEYSIGPEHRVHTRSWLVHTETGGYTLSLTAPPGEFAKYQKEWSDIQRSFQVK